MATGKINVQTENIFPIIKKFLYSDHEIFLRELVSNAVDATQKLKTLHSLGEYKGELGDLTIEVLVNKDKKTLTIKDKGIGMTEAEVKKYITQIAFSGATEFVSKYEKETKENPLIGHFGLGFYSAFMVAKKVEILTKSYKTDDDAYPVKWECEGNPDYQMDKIDKTDRGTEIVLHIAEDSEEFLETERIKALLNKYCKFLPIEIKFENTVINNPKPAWVLKPTELKQEDYDKFYQELYPLNFDKPLFNIHLNVDYPFNLTGILYFPKIKNNFEVQKDKIQLYCNQVFVTDVVQGIVPDFLTLLQGVIDSPDIPLNVSRSYLQSDANVKKINNHITKKVADKLLEMFKNNREDFQQKWNDINIFIQYGMLSEDKFYDKATEFYLFRNIDNQYFTIDEYKQKVVANQTDKDNKIVLLYANDSDKQYAFIAAAKQRGYDVLLMNSPLDSHFVNLLERKFENIHFVRVDADTIDNLIKKTNEQRDNLTDEQKNLIKPIFESQVTKEKFTIQFAPLNEQDAPVVITQPEFVRRMKEMSAVGGGMSFYGNMPEMYNMTINTNHPLMTKILLTQDTQKQNDLAKQAIDLALLSQNLLSGEALEQFIKRSLSLI